MALSLSQGLCEALVGKQTGYRSGALAIVDGGAGKDTITDASNLLTSDGAVSSAFAVGDLIEVHGAGCASNDGAYYCISASNGTLYFSTGTFSSAQSAGSPNLTLVSVKRGALKDLFYSSTLSIYSGSKPSNADAAENGTELIRFTTVMFGTSSWDSTDDYAYIDLYALTAESATALATGTAAWFRLYGGQSMTTGASTTAIRMDGTVGVGTGDLQVASTTITSGAPESLSSFKLKMPQAA